MNFPGIWYVDASQQKKMLQNTFFTLDFCLFWPFCGQKTAKIDKNEENLQNSNRLMEFFEIWFVNASQ